MQSGPYSSGPSVEQAARFAELILGPKGAAQISHDICSVLCARFEIELNYGVPRSLTYLVFDPAAKMWTCLFLTDTD
jgi:hypothetical protein